MAKRTPLQFGADVVRFIWDSFQTPEGQALLVEGEEIFAGTPVQPPAAVPSASTATYAPQNMAAQDSPAFSTRETTRRG